MTPLAPSLFDFWWRVPTEVHFPSSYSSFFPPFFCLFFRPHQGFLSVSVSVSLCLYLSLILSVSPCFSLSLSVSVSDSILLFQLSLHHRFFSIHIACYIYINSPSQLTILHPCRFLSITNLLENYTFIRHRFEASVSQVCHFRWGSNKESEVTVSGID